MHGHPWNLPTQSAVVASGNLVITVTFSGQTAGTITSNGITSTENVRIERPRQNGGHCFKRPGAASPY